ncbi:MAG: MCE family protein, partial [Actinobacteria bacterium]
MHHGDRSELHPPAPAGQDRNRGGCRGSPGLCRRERRRHEHRVHHVDVRRAAVEPAPGRVDDQVTGSRRLLAIAIAFTFVAGTVTLAVKPSTDQGSIKVTAMFTKTIGLFPSSRVMVLGVAVGRVVSVTPVGNDVKVVMRIDKARRIPADARATIVPISLISDRYVQVFPPYSSGAALKTGDVIGTDRTFIPAELDDLLTQLKKLLDALEQGTQGGSPALGVLVSNLSQSL